MFGRVAAPITNYEMAYGTAAPLAVAANMGLGPAILVHDSPPDATGLVRPLRRLRLGYRPPLRPASAATAGRATGPALSSTAGPTRRWLLHMTLLHPDLGPPRLRLRRCLATRLSITGISWATGSKRESSSSGALIAGVRTTNRVGVMGPPKGFFAANPIRWDDGLAYSDTASSGWGLSISTRPANGRLVGGGPPQTAWYGSGGDKGVIFPIQLQDARGGGRRNASGECQ